MALGGIYRRRRVWNANPVWRVSKSTVLRMLVVIWGGRILHSQTWWAKQASSLGSRTCNQIQVILEVQGGWTLGQGGILDYNFSFLFSFIRTCGKRALTWLHSEVFSDSENISGSSLSSDLKSDIQLNRLFVDIYAQVNLQFIVSSWLLGLDI